MKYMIVTDLDGTFLKLDKTYDKDTYDYLMHLKNNGHIIVIATGRVLDSVLQVTDQALFADYIIGDSGAFLYDNRKKKIIWQSVIPREYIKLLEVFPKKDVLQFEINTVTNIYKTPLSFQNHESFIIPISNASDVPENEDVSILSIFFHQNYLVHEYKAILERYISSLDFNVMQDSFKEKQWLFVTNKNVNKYTALSKVAKMKKIDLDRIIAFGDGLNDIEMLQNCGVSVAMGNALDALKQVSKYETYSNEEQGIKIFLENYLREK